MKQIATPARANRIAGAALILVFAVCATPRASSREGGRIVFGAVGPGNAARIFLTNADGSHFEALKPRGARTVWDEHPVWSPDGRTIAFSASVDAVSERIVLMESDGSNARVISDGPGDWYSTWSPDGRDIAFTSGRVGNERAGIYRHFLDSGQTVRITALDSLAASPSWRPGGGSIVYLSTRAGTEDLHLMDDLGGHIAQLTDRDTADQNPRWHPRKDVIAFTAWGERGPDGISPFADIHTIQADGSDERRLTAHPAWDADPSWSPSGGNLLFTSRRTGRPALYIMNSDGRGLRRITDRAFTAIWGSDWFDAKYPRSVSPIGRHAATWGWLKRLGAAGDAPG